jgi:stage II sporulation protein P
LLLIKVPKWLISASGCSLSAGPGISKGIYIEGKETNNTYNQDLFGNSLLVQIGGVDNSIKEEYRSVEILSDVIDDILDELE